MSKPGPMLYPFVRVLALNSASGTFAATSQASIVCRPMLTPPENCAPLAVRAVIVMSAPL